MRLQIFSDIHFDVMEAWTPRLCGDVNAVVVAGDVCEGIERGMTWLRQHLGAAVPIVMVAGNHEFYHRVRSEERRAGALAARQHHVALLDDSAIEIGGVRFIGSTLWADFSFLGDDLKPQVMRAAERVMLDHKHIIEDRATDRRFSAADALGQHAASRAWLERTLAAPFDGPTVVVTHHGVHEKSVAPHYRADLLTPAFVSDLALVIDRHQPVLWVHGHTHVSFDYRIGETRVVCNPHGYGHGVENVAFDPELVVEVG